MSITQFLFENNMRTFFIRKMMVRIEEDKKQKKI